MWTIIGHDAPPCVIYLQKGESIKVLRKPTFNEWANAYTIGVFLKVEDDRLDDLNPNEKAYLEKHRCR